MNTIRNAAKRALETLLVVGGSAALARRNHAARLLITAYHNVVPTGSEPIGDRSLHLPQRAFASQLDSLMKTHDVIPLDAALSVASLAARGRGARPFAVITFDDAYAGALTAGLQELRARGLPATIFITPAFLNGKSFWWDAFSDATCVLNSDVRNRALTEGRGLDDRVFAIASAMGLAAHEMPWYARGASTQHLENALSYKQITVAAHTWSHPNLVTLSDSELTDELTLPLQWLERFGTQALPMVSYPYGLADRRVRDAARDAGYIAGFMIAGGWAAPLPKDPFAVPRLNVPAGVSRHGFMLRTAGLIQA